MDHGRIQTLGTKRSIHRHEANRLHPGSSNGRNSCRSRTGWPQISASVVRTTSLPLLQKACLLNLCNVVQGLDGTLNQLFLVEIPNLLPVNTVLGVLRAVPGVLDAEIDVLQKPYGRRGSRQRRPCRIKMNALPCNIMEQVFGKVYALQPAASEIRLPDARAWFHVTGAAVVADIDTGVDPNHPALMNSLLAGYDFTRNQAGGSEMTDVASEPESDCSQCPVATINKTNTVVMKASTGAVLDSPGDDGFGHGTMVSGHHPSGCSDRASSCR